MEYESTTGSPKLADEEQKERVKKLLEEAAAEYKASKFRNNKQEYAIQIGLLGTNRGFTQDNKFNK